ncbi:unnamed protein product [Cunninghamella echinulata]
MTNKPKTKIAPSSNWKKLLPTIKATQSTTKTTDSKKRKFSHDKETEWNKKKRISQTKEQKEIVKIPKKEELWFDIDEKDLESAYGKKLSAKEEKTEEKKEKLK